MDRPERPFDRRPCEQGGAVIGAATGRRTRSVVRRPRLWALAALALALGWLGPLASVGPPGLMGPAELRAQAGTGAAAATAGLEVLEAAAERYRRIDALCADFKQQLVNTLLGEERVSRGRLCQRHPNFFRMDFTDPDGDLVLSDGRSFHLYYPSMNPGQVVRIPLDPERGGLDFQREFLSDPGARYDVTLEGRERVGDTMTQRLHLVPIEPSPTLEAWLWIDPDEAVIRQVRLNDRNGVQRTIELSAIQWNPALGVEAFEFVLPAGAQIVDAPGARGVER